MEGVGLFESCVLGGQVFAPARFCAPLAGYTHSAFRRLVGELGGCGAIWTEMLAARQILHEDFVKSPWLRRRPQEGRVFFQLMTRTGDPLERILGRMGEQGIDAVDLNLACNAHAIRSQAAGSALFEDFAALRGVVTEARRCWPGVLTAKIRLGSQREDWRARFQERVRFLEDAGMDAIIVHTRFFEEKFKRRARHELFDWVVSQTRMPVIANGDLLGPEHVASLKEALGPACAVMIGRLAIARPWVFATWDGGAMPDLRAIWFRMFDYIQEDFAPPIALRRIQMFTKYFAANFLFGHRWHSDIKNAPTIDAVRERAMDFFERVPATVKVPCLAGL